MPYPCWTALAALSPILLIGALALPGCKATCTAGDDCAAGEICGDDGLCAPACTRIDECAAGEQCRAGRCTPSGPNNGPHDGGVSGEQIGVTLYKYVSNANQSGYDEVPAAGVEVLFHDRAGVLVWRQKSDARGKAEASMPAGGSVTWFRAGDSSSADIHTVTDLEPGRHLDLGRYGPQPTGPLPGQGMTMIGYPPLPPGTVRRNAWTRCGSDNGSAMAWFHDECLDAQHQSALLAIAYSGEGGSVPAAFSFLYDQPLATRSGVLPLPAWSTAWGRVTAQVLHIPAHFSRGDIYVSPMRSGALYPFEGFYNLDAVPVENGVLTASATVVPDFAEQYRRSVRLSGHSGTCLATVYSSAIRSAQGVSEPVEASSFLPAFTDCTRGERSIHFRALAVTPGADYIESAFTAPNGNHRWWVATRPDATSIELPTLPDDLAAPFVGIASQGVVLVDEDWITGYADHLDVYDMQTGAALGRSPPAVTQERRSLASAAQ